MPSTVFLAALFVILLVRPQVLWGDAIDQGTRSASLILSGALAAVLSLALLRRWRVEPHTVQVDRDALVVWPAFGAVRRVPWSAVTGVAERTRPFPRGAVEMEIRAGDGRRFVVRGDVTDYPRFRALVREHLPRDATARWLGHDGS